VLDYIQASSCTILRKMTYERMSSWSHMTQYQTQCQTIEIKFNWNALCRLF